MNFSPTVVREQTSRRNLAVVVEQHVDTALAIADRTAVLSEGNTVLSLSGSELAANTEIVRIDLPSPLTFPSKRKLK